MQAKVLQPAVDEPPAWEPTLGSNGKVEINALVLNDKGRYPLTSVSPEEYLGFMDAKEIKYLAEGLPRPEGNPSREEVLAFLRGDLKAVSRNGSKFERPVDPNRAVHRDPVAYRVPTRDKQTGVELEDDGEAQPEPYQTIRPVKPKPPAQTRKPAQEPYRPVSRPQPPPQPEEEEEEVDELDAETMRQNIIAEYQRAAVVIRSRMGVPNAASLAAELNLPVQAVRMFLAFNPDFEELKAKAEPAAAVPRVVLKPVVSPQPSIAVRQEPPATAGGKRKTRDEKITALTQAAGELRSKNRVVRVIELIEKAHAILKSGTAGSLKVFYYSDLTQAERDSIWGIEPSP